MEVGSSDMADMADMEFREFNHGMLWNSNITHKLAILYIYVFCYNHYEWYLYWNIGTIYECYWNITNN